MWAMRYKCNEIQVHCIFELSVSGIKVVLLGQVLDEKKSPEQLHAKIKYSSVAHLKSEKHFGCLRPNNNFVQLPKVSRLD